MVKTLTKFDDKEKVNILQKQFVSVFKEEPNDEVPVFNKKNLVNLSNINNTDETVQKEIVKLNLKKSFRPDKMHPQI